MVFLLLRINGLASWPEEFAAAHRVEPSACWHKGDRQHRGRTAVEHGISFILQEQPSWIEALPAVQQFIRSNESMLRSANAEGASIELSVGVTVGEVTSFAPSLDFAPPFLQQLGTLNIALCVSAYPTSDET